MSVAQMGNDSVCMGSMTATNVLYSSLIYNESFPHCTLHTRGADTARKKVTQHTFNGMAVNDILAVSSNF
jgi:hypothetical protein